MKTQIRKKMCMFFLLRISEQTLRNVVAEFSKSTRQAAADVFGSKTNVELSFAARPSVTELTRATEVAFSNDISLRRPEGVPQHSFHLSKFKIYDEDRNKWVDLHSDSQLSEFCQLYAFQPENPWHKETQKDIPPAVKPPALSPVVFQTGRHISPPTS